MSAATPVLARRVLLSAPRLLFVVAVLVLAVGAVARWGDRPALVMVGLYLAWLLFEVPVTFRGATPVKDVRTLVPYALARIATVGTGLLLVGPGTSWSTRRVVGAALFVGGVVLREVAIRTLGRFYSHHVAMRTDQVAVTAGPYRVIRHPAYAGMLVAHLGFVAFFANPVSLGCLVLLAVAVVYRIRVEERTLSGMPGYAAYAVRRPRLIPGVW